MTAAQTYTVDVVYHGHTQGAENATDRVAGMVGGLQSRIDSVTAAMDRMALVGVAAVGGVAAAGIRRLAGDMVHLNSVTQDTEIAIAGMLQANNAAGSFAEGMGAASTALAQIRRDADALPGEAQDFVNVFSVALPAALQAGMRNALDVSRFTNQFAAVGIALHVDADQAGRDLRLLLQGRAGSQVAMWNQLQALVGKTAEEFNQMSAPRRLAALQTATGRYADMVGAFGGTFSTAMSTVLGRAHRLGELATKPLFDRATAKLAELGTYLSTHGDQIEARVVAWGYAAADGFDRAFERGRALVEYTRTHWRELADEAESVGRRVLSVYVGLRAASTAVSVVNGVSSVAGLVGGVAAVSAAGPVAAGALLMAGAGALAIHDGAFDAAGAMRDLTPTALILKRGLGELGEQVRPLVTSFAATNLGAIVTVVDVFGSIVGGLSMVAAKVIQLEREVVGIALDPMRNAYRTLFGAHAATMGNAMAMTEADVRAMNADTRAAGSGLAQFRVSATSRPGVPTPAAKTHHTTIHNNFRIEQADNPERVALSVMHVIQRELRNPTQSARPGVVTLR